MSISPQAIVHPEAKLGQNVSIGPFSYIDKEVVIGDNCIIEPNVTIYSGSTLGESCHVFPGAVIGAVPQDLKFVGEESYVVIGDRVTIRECCTINRATSHSITTRVGNDVLLMAYVHVAHDCQLGNNIILANAVNLAGHVHVHDFATLGGMVAVHQFTRIGAYAMVGGGSLVRKDVPPYVLASREPLSFLGINSVGLGRRGFSKEQMQTIKDIYQHYFVNNESLAEIKNNFVESEERDRILKFIATSERGLIRGPQLN